MSRRRVSTPVAFVATYLAVFAVMVAWWLGLQAAAETGPALTVLVAYAVPTAAWVVLARLYRQKRDRA